MPPFIRSTRLASGGLVLCLCAIALLALACPTGERRAARHLENSDVYAAEGRFDEAMIELHSAYRLAPGDASIAFRIAELSSSADLLAEARFYYGEAYRIDRSRTDAAVRRADLLRASRPAEASELLAEIAVLHPDDPWTAIGLSEAAIHSGNPRLALQHAKRAFELDSGLAEAHGQLARAHIAEIGISTLTGRLPTTAMVNAAIEALDGFAELDPERAWVADLERTRVLMAGGRFDAARAAARSAVEATLERGLRRPAREALERAAEIGRTTRNLDFEIWALEKLTELRPMDGNAWEALALATEKRGGSAREVLISWAKRVPEHVPAHVRVANFLASSQGVPAARFYLTVVARGGVDPAALYAALARIELRHGSVREAFERVSRLEEDYPDHPETQIMVAWRWMELDREDLALAVLREIPDADDSIDAQRVLADTHARAGDPASTAKAIRRLIELGADPGPRMLRLHANALHDLGEFQQALRIYTELHRTDTLTPPEQLNMARCFYEMNGQEMGRSFLLKLVDTDNPFPPAVRELMRREGTQARHLQRLRRAYGILLETFPLYPGYLRDLSQLELRAGNPERAEALLAEAVDTARSRKRPTAPILLLQTEVLREIGSLDAARATSLEALANAPSAETLDLAVELHADPAVARRTIDGLRPERSAELRPDQYALLARLYEITGDPVLARAAYDQALLGGLHLPDLMRSLAFLLARQGREVQRALDLARAAQRALGDDALTLDALGYAYLANEDHAAALDHFQRALAAAERSGDPQAELRYHVGLALQRSGNPMEAAEAFETALSLDAEFRGAEDARRELARSLGDG